MKQFIILFIIIFSGESYSQKIIEKHMDGSSIYTIEISGNNMFKIHVSTHKTNDIQAILKIEGDNSEQVLLQAYMIKDTLFVGSSYQPMFIPPDNKLGAHKQISIELTLIIPEKSSLNITSDIASVFLRGNFKATIVELLNGNFKATKYLGNLLVNTLHGNISLETNNAQLELYSKNGNLYQEKLVIGINQIIVNSINGNISITKTQ